MMFVPAGAGRENRQHAIVGGRINDGTLFPNIAIAITEQIGIIAEVEQGELREATRGIVAQIRGDSDLVLMAPRPREEEVVWSAESARQLAELAGDVDGLQRDVRRIGEALAVAG